MKFTQSVGVSYSSNDTVSLPYRAMAEPRAAKLRRLEQFRRRVPYVSASALSAILAEVDRAGVPDARSRRDMRDARNLEVDDATPYGPLFHVSDLPAVNGGTIPLRIVHPLSFLWKAFNTCDPFASFIDSCLERTPCTPETPWNLILYSDEVTPGDCLVHDNRRKMQVVYFSFFEFGPAALSREDAWFTIAAKRSSEVNKISGGMSAVFGAILLLFFVTGGSNVALAGLALHRSGEATRHIYARLRCFVQDGGAHKITWHCKGDSGLKLCMLCKNLFTGKSDLCEEDNSNLLVCNVIDDTELDFASDADILNAVQNLAARHATDTPGAFKERETISGFTHTPHNMLLDRRLDNIVLPASQFMHDWMHTLFSSGVFNTLVFRVFEAFIDAGIEIWEIAHGYASTYKWPSRMHTSTLVDVLSPKGRASSRAAKSLKCQASDGLSLMAVIAIFISLVALPWGVCTAECMALIAFADVVDFMYNVPRGGITPAMLRSAVHKFLCLYVRAFTVNGMSPKFHWLLHFAYHLDNFGTLLSCFVHERKHRMVKRYANDIVNTRVFELSVLNEVTCHHLSTLLLESTFDFRIGLVRPHAASPSLRGWIASAFDIGDVQPVLTGSESRINKLATCRRNDVVYVSDAHGGFVAGQVWVHLDIGGTPMSVVSIWCFVAINKEHGTAEWRASDNPMMVRTCDILDVSIWTRLDSGNIRTLLPCHLR